MNFLTDWSKEEQARLTSSLVVNSMICSLKIDELMVDSFGGEIPQHERPIKAEHVHKLSSIDP